MCEVLDRVEKKGYDAGRIAGKIAGKIDVFYHELGMSVSEIAEKLSIITGIPWDDSLVLKIRNTKSQKKLDAAQRRNNLRKAYEVTRELEGIPVLITDDVYTTGSTMDAMSMCLFEAGAQAVYFLTVCAGRQ